MGRLPRHDQESKSPLPVYAGGKVQGKVLDDQGRRVFVRRVTWSRHLFRSLRGWSASEEVVRHLQDLQVALIRYHDDREVTWEITLADFLGHAEQRQFDDLQYICPVRFWSQVDDDGGSVEQLALAI